MKNSPKNAVKQKGDWKKINAEKTNVKKVPRSANMEYGLCLC